MNPEPVDKLQPRAPLGEIAREFLRLGFIAFGGPAAHIALMEEEFVRRRNWVTRERFLDLVGAVSLLPGPSSTELAIYLGQIRGGLLGLIVAGTAFVLPAAILVIGLAWAYVRFGAVPQVAGLLFAVKPVVVVLIAQAIWILAKAALRTVPLAALATLVIALSAFGVPALILLIGGGLVWMAAREVQTLNAKRTAAFVVLGRIARYSMPAVVVGLSSVFLYFLKVGAVLFGSGYVLLALLRADLVVRLHWLTEPQLLDAIAVSQATPGPFFTVSTFIGYLLGGWRGAVLATVGMFLPAFVYVAATANFLPRLRKSRAASAFLDGVNAAAVALMAFVGWQFARAALASIPAIVLAVISGVLVFRFRVNSAWVIAGAAMAGIVLGLFHLN
ncbi:MAG TPA: chromate efflux transporter [Methylomirabilota bacterium]|nr:chromate efflux transporter [Methylomirabilota bacterium]